MLAIFAKTTLELAMVLLLIYGFMHEKELIKFEHYLKMVVVVNYRRYKKRKRLEQMRKNREFRLVRGGKSATPKRTSGSTFVA
jgi:hypothetical protein